MHIRRSLTAKQREELYVVGSVVWFANGTMATQCLAEGGRVECEAYAETAEHPLQPGDVVHPERPARMLVTTKTEWLALIANAKAADGFVQ